MKIKIRCDMRACVAAGVEPAESLDVELGDLTPDDRAAVAAVIDDRGTVTVPIALPTVESLLAAAREARTAEEAQGLPKTIRDHVRTLDWIAERVRAGERGPASVGGDGASLPPITLSRRQVKAMDRVGGADLILPWPAELPPGPPLDLDEERDATPAEHAVAERIVGPARRHHGLVPVRSMVAVCWYAEGS